MESNSIILQNVSAEQLTDLIGNVFDTKFKSLQKIQNTQTANEDLMTRSEVLAFLKINASTLFHWQNKGKIIVYKFANKCYYKRSELMATITPLIK